MLYNFNYTFAIKVGDTFKTENQRYKGVYRVLSLEKNTVELVSLNTNVDDFSIPTVVQDVYGNSSTYTVVSIADGAYESCEGIEQITIPSSITYIGKDFFNMCTTLNFIKVDNGNSIYRSEGGVVYTKNGEGLVRTPPAYNKSYNVQDQFHYNSVSISDPIFDIPEFVSNIHDYAFKNCRYIKQISIPNNLKDIGVDAFASCESLEHINMPDSIYTIPNGAFKECILLNDITIPQNVNSIGSKAFGNCTSLLNIFEHSSTPPVLSSDAFENVPLDVVVFVPKNSKQYYNKAPIWENFVNIKEMGNLQILNYTEELILSQNEIAIINPTILKEEDVEIVNEAWSVSDPNIVDFDSGRIIGLSEGETTLSYVIVDNYNRKYIKECRIVVHKGAGANFLLKDDDVSPLKVIYDLNGKLIKKDANKDDLNNLSTGIYLYDKKKVLVK